MEPSLEDIKKMRTLSCGAIIALWGACVQAGIIIASEDFETGAATGWSNNKVTDSGHPDYTKFLGRFSKVGGQGVYKTFTGLPGGPSLVTVQFDFYQIDSWDNEYFRVYIDDTQVANHRYHHNTVATHPGVTFLGGGWDQVFSGWSDRRYRYQFKVPTTDTQIKLGFGDSLNSGISDESWGIDNLVISYVALSGDRTWNSGATGDWTSVGNWDDGPPPPSHTPATTKPTATENAYIPAGTVNVTTAESAFSLDIGKTLPTGNPVVDVNAGSSLDVLTTTEIGATGRLEINGAFETLTISSVPGSMVNLNDGGSLTATNGSLAAVTLSGTATVETNGALRLSNVAGSGGLIKAGAGTLTLDTANTYSGQTTVNGGILLITNGGALGDTTAGTVVNNGAQLLLGTNNIVVDSGESITISGNGPGNSGAIYAQAGGNMNIDGPVSLGADSRINVAPGASARLRLRGGLDLGTHKLTAVTAGSGERLEIAAPMTGTGELRKEGNGRIEAKAASPDYSGQVRITNGYVEAWATNALGTGQIIAESDGTLLLRNGVTLPNDVVINTDGEGTAGAIRNENSTNTITGTVTSINDASRIHVQSGQLNLTNTLALQKDVKVYGNGTRNITGQVTGSGDIKRYDNGTLILAGDNSFTGEVLIAGGTLRLTSDNALGSPAGGTTLTGGAVLELQGGINIGPEPLTIGSATSSGEKIVNLGGSTNSFAGDITLGPAKASLPASSATIENHSGTLILGGNIAMNKSNLVVEADPGTTTIIDGVISGTNTSTEVYTPGLLAGSHSGNVWMGTPNPGNFGIVLGPQGMFRDGGPNDALREAHWRAPRADGGNGPNNTTLIYTGQVNLAALGDANGTVTFIEQNDDKTRLYVNGVQIISDDSWNDAVRGTYTPPSPGWYDFEVRFSNGGGGYGFTGQQNTGAGDSNWDKVDWGFGYAPGVVNNDDALNYNYPQDPGDGSIFRVVYYANSNDLIKRGSGTLILNGDNTYAGKTEVEEGTLIVNGTTSGQGTYTVHPGAVLGGSGEIGAMVNIINALLSPGMSIGTLTIVGDTTLDGGELYIEVADTRPGNESFDQLVIDGGTLDLINGASLTVATPLDALKMHVGAEITIVDALAGGNVSGEFDGLPDGTEFTDENGVYRWQISYGGSPDHDITLRLTYIPEPASIVLLGLGSLLVARRRRRR